MEIVLEPKDFISYQDALEYKGTQIGEFKWQLFRDGLHRFINAKGSYRWLTTSWVDEYIQEQDKGDVSVLSNPNNGLNFEEATHVRKAYVTKTLLEAKNLCVIEEKRNSNLAYHIQGIHFVDDFRVFLTTQADKTKKSLYSGVLQETLQLDGGRLYFETVAVHSPKNEKLNQDSIIIRKEMDTCADLIPTQYIGFTKEADLTE